MSEIEKVLKSVVMGGIGAAATVVEEGAKLAKTFVEKGEQTVRQNQDAADQFCQKVRSACEAAKVSFDIARMTPEERAELRRQLDEYEAAEAAWTKDEGEAEPDVEESPIEEEDVPAEDAPTEDVYTAGDDATSEQ